MALEDSLKCHWNGLNQWSMNKCVKFNHKSSPFLLQDDDHAIPWTKNTSKPSLFISVEWEHLRLECPAKLFRRITVLPRWNWLGVFFFNLLGSVNKCCWYYKFYSADTLSSVRERGSVTKLKLLWHTAAFEISLFFSKKKCIRVFTQFGFTFWIFKGLR